MMIFTNDGFCAKIEYSINKSNHMAYIFGLLFVLNIAMFGYFMTVPKGESESVKSAKISLQSPLEYKNTTNQLPPEIGQKN